MNPKTAIEVIRQVCEMATMSWKDHSTVQTAIRTLEMAISAKEPAKPAAKETA